MFKKKKKTRPKLRCALSSFDFLFCGVWSICHNFLYEDLLKASTCPNLLGNTWEESCLDPTTRVSHTTQIPLSHWSSPFFSQFS